MSCNVNVHICVTAYKAKKLMVYSTHLMVRSAPPCSWISPNSRFISYIDAMAKCRDFNEQNYVQLCIFFCESDLSNTNYGADVVIACVSYFFHREDSRQHGFHSSNFLWVTLGKISALMGVLPCFTHQSVWI